MNGIERVFDRLDRWRCLPDYQLERRADLFFSLYLPEILEDLFGHPFRPFVVPEFPIKQKSNLSDKVDYVALSSDFKQLVLVELKTNMKSLRETQFEYLRLGACKSGEELLTDLKTIHKASRAKPKYDALSAELAVMGFTETRAKTIKANHPVVLIAPETEFKKRAGIESIFKRKKEVPFHIVGFETVRVIVLRHGDPVSQRFAESLKMWIENPV